MAQKYTIFGFPAIENSVLTDFPDVSVGVLTSFPDVLRSVLSDFPDVLRSVLSGFPEKIWAASGFVRSPILGVMRKTSSDAFCCNKC